MIKICWKDHQQNARFDFFTLMTMGLLFFFFNCAVWQLVINISRKLNAPIFRLVEFYVEDKGSWFIKNGNKLPDDMVSHPGRQ